MFLQIPVSYNSCDMEKFVMGLRQLLSVCHVVGCQYNEILGICSLSFADGSKIAIHRAFKETGYFPNLD